MPARLSILAALAGGLACGGAGPRPDAPPTDADAQGTQGRALSFEETALAPPAELRASGSPLVVHLIDVGQGAATLLEFPCAAVLVDVGGESNGQFRCTPRLVEYLDAFFARRSDLNRTLAALYITHPHIDHARDARTVAERYSAQHVITNGHANGRGQTQLIEWAEGRGVHRGASVDELPDDACLTDAAIDPVDCGAIDPELQVLWGRIPDRTTGAFDNPNMHSVALRVDVGEASLLITGDLQSPALELFVERYAGIARATGTNFLDVDIYQVGHHGSHNATSVALLEAMTPELALISVGPSEREIESMTAWEHGHPRANVIDELLAHVARRRQPIDVRVATGQHEFERRAINRAIYATAWDGDVRVFASADGRFVTRRGR